MVACHRASIDEVLTQFSIVLTGTFHGSTNFELSRRESRACAIIYYNNATVLETGNGLLKQRYKLPHAPD